MDYLASPYTSKYFGVQHTRYLEAMRAVVWLINRKRFAYSPIVHCHEMARLHQVPTDFHFWREYNYETIDRFAGVIVLRTKGWRESKGLRDEVDYALEKGKPVHTLAPERVTDDYTLLENVNEQVYDAFPDLLASPQRRPTPL